MKQDPTKWAGLIVTLIEAVIAMAVSFGWLSVTEEQTQLIINVVVPLIAVLAPIWGFYYTRKNATPLTNPRDADLEPFVRADGAQPMRKIKK